MILINSIILEHLKTVDNVELKIFNLGNGKPTGIHKFIFRTLAVSKLIFALICNYKNRKNTILYMPVSHGIGKFFEIFPWTISASLVKYRIMHHHAYNYILKKSYLMSVMQKGNNIKNIFLCSKHLSDFELVYDIKLSEFKTLIFSNDFYLNYLIKKNKRFIETKSPLRVGFLSNLTLDKGVLEVLEIVQAYKENNNFHFSIAGPIYDESINVKIKDLSQVSNFVYLGPLYGQDKYDWFESIDIFLFPSKSKIEVYPLVVLEALFFGIIPLTTNIGCITFINVPEFSSDSGNYVKFAINFLNRFISDQNFKEHMKHINYININNHINNSNSQMNSFINFLLS